jgi:hypothetical protein
MLFRGSSKRKANQKRKICRRKTKRLKRPINKGFILPSQTEHKSVQINVQIFYLYSIDIVCVAERCTDLQIMFKTHSEGKGQENRAFFHYPMYKSIKKHESSPD